MIDLKTFLEEGVKLHLEGGDALRKKYEQALQLSHEMVQKYSDLENQAEKDSPEKKSAQARRIIFQCMVMLYMNILISFEEFKLMIKEMITNETV